MPSATPQRTSVSAEPRSVGQPANSCKLQSVTYSKMRGLAARKQRRKVPPIQPVNIQSYSQPNQLIIHRLSSQSSTKRKYDFSILNTKASKRAKLCTLLAKKNQTAIRANQLPHKLIPASGIETQTQRFQIMHSKRRRLLTRGESRLCTHINRDSSRATTDQGSSFPQKM